MPPPPPPPPKKKKKKKKVISYVSIRELFMYQQNVKRVHTLQVVLYTVHSAMLQTEILQNDVMFMYREKLSVNFQKWDEHDTLSGVAPFHHIVNKNTVGTMWWWNNFPFHSILHCTVAWPDVKGGARHWYCTISFEVKLHDALAPATLSPKSYAIKRIGDGYFNQTYDCVAENFASNTFKRPVIVWRYCYFK